MKILKTAAALLLAATLLVACGSDDAEPEGGGGGTAVDVIAADFAFKPTIVRVDPGEEVTLTLENQGEAEHSFTSEELDIEVEAEGGESAETTFTAPAEDGSFEFFCEYHPDEMRGELHVGNPPGGGMPTDDGGGDGDGNQY